MGCWFSSSLERLWIFLLLKRDVFFLLCLFLAYSNKDRKSMRVKRCQCNQIQHGHVFFTLFRWMINNFIYAVVCSPSHVKKKLRRRFFEVSMRRWCFAFSFREHSTGLNFLNLAQFFVRFFVIRFHKVFSLAQLVSNAGNLTTKLK